MNTLYLDFETYSATPIGNGTYRYAEDAEVLLMAYATNDDDVQVIDFTIKAEREKYTEMLRKSIARDDVEIVIHNAMFDRVIARYALGIEIPPEKINDTMVMALMHGLPAKLDLLCTVFNLPVDKAKDKEGKKLIRKFCMPQPLNKKRVLPMEARDDWLAFMNYARLDVVAMRELYKLLPRWNFAIEKPLWVLDQKINDRGFKVDVELAEKAVLAVEKAQAELAVRAESLSEGYVDSGKQVAALLAHFMLEHGVSMPDLTKSTVERRLNDPELPSVVRELLAVRLDASTSSTSKYTKLIEAVNKDERLRGTLQFDGAGRTGRWAGRTFQPQNLPRPQHKQVEIDFAIEMLLGGWLHLFTDDVMKLTSSCIRSTITASKWRKLCVADLSNIEGRMAAWLAGETWKIKAFYDFDAGTGPDLYKLAYSRSFLVPVDTVTKEQRGIGKVQELALGYGGGVGAFVTMAAGYRIDLNDMSKKAAQSIPDETMAQAANFWGKTTNRYELSREVFTTCDAIKRLWRKSQPEISTMWWELEDAVRTAVANPKVVQECRKVRIVRRKNWLLIYLPSGRALCYPAIQVDDEGTISYMGVNTYTHQWSRIKTYGGKLFENICQAAARDVLAHNMPLVEAAGYEIVLTVHDELLTETDSDPTFNGKELAELMATVPPWATGLPLAAAGFETFRYMKEE